MKDLINNAPTYSKEVQDEAGKGWRRLLFGTFFITFGFLMYCIFNLTFTWWLPFFGVLFLVIAWRYGTVLEQTQKDMDSAKTESR